VIGFKVIVNHVGNVIVFVAKFSNLDPIDLRIMFGVVTSASAVVNNKIKIIIILHSKCNY